MAPEILAAAINARLLPGEPVQDKLRDRLRLLALQEVAAAGTSSNRYDRRSAGLVLHHLGPLVLGAAQGQGSAP